MRHCRNNHGRLALVEVRTTERVQLEQSKLAFRLLAHGWSIHEPVYRLRSGYPRDPDLPSRFNDGFIGRSDWAPRLPWTLLRWDFKDNGSVRAMVQQAPPKHIPTTIPIDRVLHLVADASTGSPESRARGEPEGRAASPAEARAEDPQGRGGGVNKFPRPLQNETLLALLVGLDEQHRALGERQEGKGS